MSSRLSPRAASGVFCLYSHGTSEQAYALRQTASRVFPFGESLFDGYLLLLSNEPLVLSKNELASKLQAPGAFWEEVRSWHETATASAITQLIDSPRLPWRASQLVVTDNHPIVEYPHYLVEKMKRLP